MNIDNLIHGLIGLFVGNICGIIVGIIIGRRNQLKRKGGEK